MNAQASYARDLAALYGQDDPIHPAATDGALHVAAALGLPNFAREVVDRSPELAFGFDERGLTPCHLAVAKGHASVVKALMDSNVGFDVCLLRDKGGFLVVHAAVMKGRVEVLKEVRDRCPLPLLRESTCLGDSILHLAVKYDSSAAFDHFSRLFHGDYELFNRKDAEGNTILHIAVAKRQLQIVKKLLRRSSKMDVNTVNLYGSTALDMAFASENERGDATLAEMIRTAGGRKGVELDLLHPQQDQLKPHDPLSKSAVSSLWQRFYATKVALSRRASSDKEKATSDTLMVVATLIATITFQGALNPPGGFYQDGDKVGQAVMEPKLGDFLVLDMAALVASLSVILLTIYMVPRWKDTVKLSMFLVWISVFFTMWSFLSAIPVIFPRLSKSSWVAVTCTLGDIVVQLFALFLFVLSWLFLHKRCSSLLRGRSVLLRRIVLSSIPVLGASVVWGPWFLLDLASYFLPHLTVYPTLFE